MEGVEPGVTLRYLTACQPDPHRAIQPARTFRKRAQQGLGQEQAFSPRGYRTEPQFASLISPVQHHAPAKNRPLVPVPVQHPGQLLA